MSNVTPIRSGGDTSGTGGTAKKPRAPRKPKAGMVLFESGEFEGFSTENVLDGLHGVCVALDQLDMTTSDPDLASELAIAARVLSSILQRRVASEREVRL